MLPSFDTLSYGGARRAPLPGSNSVTMLSDAWLMLTNRAPSSIRLNRLNG